MGQVGPDGGAIHGHEPLHGFSVGEPFELVQVGRVGPDRGRRHAAFLEASQEIENQVIVAFHFSKTNICEVGRPISAILRPL